MFLKKIFLLAAVSGTAALAVEDVSVFDESFFDGEDAAENAPEPEGERNVLKPAEESVNPPSESGAVTVLEELSVEDEAEDEAPAADTKTEAESVTVLDTKELQGSSATIADVANRSSGVKVRQSGGLGGEAKINIRGMEGKNVKVLVNGIPVKNGDGDLSVGDIPIDKIERVEVYKSYVPERFATDGMGGAINIVTRELPKSSVTASYSFGSFNTHKASLDAKYVHLTDSLKSRAVETGISAYYNYSDNDYEFTTPYMDTTVTREHNRYYGYNISPFVNLKNYWFDKISVGGGYSASALEVQSTSHRVERMMSRSDGFGATFGLEKSHLWLNGLSVSLGFSYSDFDDRLIDTSHVYYYGWGKDAFRESSSPLGELTVGSPTWNTRDVISLEAPWNAVCAFNENHSLTWSGLYRYESQDSEDKLLGNANRVFNNAPFSGYDYSVISGLSLENFFWGRRIQNVLGAKGYFYHLDAEDGEERMTRLGDENVQKKDFGYSENLKVRILESISIRGGYQHSLRFPTREEIFGDGLYIASAPTLKPEKSDNFTVGLDFDFDRVPFLLKVHLAANGFYLLMDDRIYLSPYSSTPRPCYNSAGTKTKGFEFEAAADLNEYLNLSWNMTRQDARSREDDKAYGISSDWIVPNVPRFFMNFGAEAHAGDLLFAEDFFKVYWLANYTDEYYYSWKVSKKQSRIIPSSFSMDVGVEYSILANRLSWNFEVRNLTDETVYDKYGDSKPGRAFSTKLRISL